MVLDIKPMNPIHDTIYNEKRICGKIKAGKRKIEKVAEENKINKDV